MNPNHPEGATPLDPDELDGLKLSHITTREELDRWEQSNIIEAETTVFSRKPKDILTEAFSRRLHKLMFGKVWKWAGIYRKTGKNIGIEPWMIPIEVKKLCDNTVVWIEHKTYIPDEIAARFHHRMVLIHPFSNGNGRHARTMTDLILAHILNRPRFSWGSENITSPGECRNRYITALKNADRGDFDQLYAFVRS